MFLKWNTSHPSALLESNPFTRLLYLGLFTLLYYCLYRPKVNIPAFFQGVKNFHNTLQNPRNVIVTFEIFHFHKKRRRKRESLGPVIAVFILLNSNCIVSFNHIIVILLCSKFNWQLYEDRFSLSGNQSLLLQGNPWFLYFQILWVVLPIECLLGDVFWEHAGEIIYPGLPWRNLCIQTKKKGDGRQREGSLG